MPAPRDPADGLRPVRATVYDTEDRDRTDPARRGTPDRVLPRARARHVEIRNGVPWKPYPGTLHLLARLRELEEESGV